jgi:hypothetical protein
MIGLATWTKPVAGMFLWLQLSGVVDSRQLIREGGVAKKFLMVLLLFVIYYSFDLFVVLVVGCCCCCGVYSTFFNFIFKKTVGCIVDRFREKAFLPMAKQPIVCAPLLAQ